MASKRESEWPHNYNNFVEDVMDEGYLPREEIVLKLRGGTFRGRGFGGAVLSGRNRVSVNFEGIKPDHITDEFVFAVSEFLGYKPAISAEVNHGKYSPDIPDEWRLSFEWNRLNGEGICGPDESFEETSGSKAYRRVLRID